MERKFLAVFAATALFLAGCMVGLNWYVDPFARHASVDDGFDRGPAYTLNRRLFKLIAFDRWMAEHQGGPPSLVIGDSTANQLDDEALTAITGRPWYSMAFGGAGLNEMTELADYVLDNYPVKEIVWGVPFTRMMGDVESDMPRSIEMANSPWKHMFTYEALQASLLVLRSTWTGVGFNDPALDTGGEDVVTYQLSRTKTEMSGRPWPAKELAALAQTLARAEERGIPVTILIPPVHPRTAEMFRQDFADRYAQYREFLAPYCVVDFTTPEEASRWPAAMFGDSVHLSRRDKPLLTEALGRALPAPCATTGPRNGKPQVTSAND
ncbi:MAG TPA: hypothetical protein VHL31_06370 [Geminicoccus sp.]|jgi:hypothetical protein|uniref:hypothetical protein n=1 Tax=Geminicoccus sp. TaxID=2024832 RepID=UPI002E2EFAED|nr:hypothetical protein [Geminicoccus sp.]HEX2525916.1 hypothetical protein [Geminicoccus sp.]